MDNHFYKKLMNEKERLESLEKHRKQQEKIRIASKERIEINKMEDPDYYEKTELKPPYFPKNLTVSQELHMNSKDLPKTIEYMVYNYKIKKAHSEMKKKKMIYIFGGVFILLLIIAIIVLIILYTKKNK